MIALPERAEFPWITTDRGAMIYAVRGRSQALVETGGSRSDRAVTWAPSHGIMALMGTIPAITKFEAANRQCAALEDAFRCLPIKRFDAAAGIPYESEIPGMGRQLILMKHVPRPMNRSVKKDIRSLVSYVGRTLTLLERLPNSATGVLNYQDGSLTQLKSSLRVLWTAAQLHTDNGRPGAREKLRARKIACIVAWHYYGLTGRKPTVPKDSKGKPSGHFLKLLKTVFEILDIERELRSLPRDKAGTQLDKASSYAQAEWVSRNWQELFVQGYGTWSIKHKKDQLTP